MKASAQEGANESVLMHWNRKILSFLQEIDIFRKRRGLLEAWGRKILIFLQENECFCGALRSWWMNGSAGRAKNIAFPAGKCIFLETEAGLVEAWGRKISIFLQENECFC